jgi:ubiquitin-protein ligase
MSLVLKRLNRELLELQKHPVPGIGVEPSEENIMIWHFTMLPSITSVYKDIPFHGTVEFTENYPMIAPKLYFQNKIWARVAISQDKRGFYSPCMSINSVYDSYHPEWAKDAKHGWSGSSSMTHFFLQLQFMMFIDNELLFTEKAYVDDTRNSCLTIKCDKCNHDGSDVSKYRPLIRLPLGSVEPSISDEKVEESILTVASSSSIPPVIGKYEPICYVSRDRVLYTQEVFGTLWNITPRLTETDVMLGVDYMSRSVWNSGPEFRFFSDKQPANFLVPLYFTKEHWSIAKDTFKQTITKITLDYDILGILNLTHDLSDELITVRTLLHTYNGINTSYSENCLIPSFFINQTVQQFFDELSPLITDVVNHYYEDFSVRRESGIRENRFVRFHSHLFSMIRDPTLLQKYMRVAIWSTIYSNKVKYLSMSPEILDRRVIAGNGAKVFNILKDELLRYVIMFLISGFNSTHDHEVPINDQLGDEWLNIFKVVKSIKTMVDFFNLVFIDEKKKWSEVDVDLEIYHIFRYFDKRENIHDTGAHHARYFKHLLKKVKAMNKKKNLK